MTEKEYLESKIAECDTKIQEIVNEVNRIVAPYDAMYKVHESVKKDYQDRLNEIEMQTQPCVVERPIGENPPKNKVVNIKTAMQKGKN
jgi:hypothetical protein